MKPHYKPSEDGYSLYGFEPPELQQSHGFFRNLYWKWVVEFALREKDRDLARGLDKDGKPLAPISEFTKKHRRSAMTPSGKGDPSAPPLTPGWQKSRTRSLLTGKAFKDHAEFWWKFDAFTHDSWAAILREQVKQGRDVFGLSPRGIKAAQRAAISRWTAYKQGRFDEPEEKPIKRPAPPKQERIAGSLDIKGKTAQEWIKHFRGTAPAVLVGRPKQPKAMSPISGPLYNRLISHAHQPIKQTPINVQPPSWIWRK